MLHCYYYLVQPCAEQNKIAVHKRIGIINSVNCVARDVINSVIFFSTIDTNDTHLWLCRAQHSSWYTLLGVKSCFT